LTVLRPAEVAHAQAEMTEGDFGEGEPAYSEAA
jgi:hypothetical protein